MYIRRAYSIMGLKQAGGERFPNGIPGSLIWPWRLMNKIHPSDCLPYSHWPRLPSVDRQVSLSHVMPQSEQAASVQFRNPSTPTLLPCLFQTIIEYAHGHEVRVLTWCSCRSVGWSRCDWPCWYETKKNKQQVYCLLQVQCRLIAYCFAVCIHHNCVAVLGGLSCLSLGWVPPPDIPEVGSAVERPTDQPFAPRDPCLGQPVHVAPFPLAGKFVSAGVS